MKKVILNVLACPRCKGGLTLDENEIVHGETKEGKLTCVICKSVFPVTRFIPRFVQSDEYVRSFSFEWQRHGKVQFGRESEETFSLKNGLSPSELKGKLVLDAGCGSGRFIDVARKWGAEVIGFDLSYSVDEAFTNLGFLDRVHFVQADIRNPPFKEGMFDYIYSIGVIHHTPNGGRAFSRLPNLLKRRGKISIWVYPHWRELGVGAKIYYMTTGLYRKFTTRLPTWLLHWACYFSIPLYYSKKVPYLGRLLHVMLPTSLHSNWKWRILDTFDWYSPQYQHHYTYDDVVLWFKHAGLVKIKPLATPISVVGERA